MDLDKYFEKNWRLGKSLMYAAQTVAEIPIQADPKIKVWDTNHIQIATLFYSSLPILSQDHSGNLNFYNLAAEGVFGYTPNEAIGMPAVNLVPAELRGIRAEHFKRVLEYRIAVSLQSEKRRRKDGSLVEISAIVFPYLLDGTPSVAAKVELI
jgi:PAS domain S-box-containing protein